MTAQRPPRDRGRPGEALQKRLETRPGWADESLEELKRQQDFDLWADCMDAALSPLRDQLERAWAHAASMYRSRRETD